MVKRQERNKEYVKGGIRDPISYTLKIRVDGNTIHSFRIS